MKTSKVKFVEPKGKQEMVLKGEKKTFNEYYVGMENGDNRFFLALGEFKRKVGDTIHYAEKDLKKSTAKLLPPPPSQVQVMKTDNKDAIQQFIIRQSMLKAAVDYHAKKAVPIETIKDTAREFIKFIHNG